jgi:hypothetical protein
MGHETRNLKLNILAGVQLNGKIQAMVETA